MDVLSNSVPRDSEAITESQFNKIRHIAIVVFVRFTAPSCAHLGKCWESSPMAGPLDIQKSDRDLNPAAADRMVGPFQRFRKFEAAGGTLLIFCALIAFIWASSFHHVVHFV
jgi:hypothetical protein